ncbi:MAG: YkvI family membrane protein [Tissierella sp.]|uniref:YkvI family membrane protein n=1 Tax=Tissierella sp. TaxID=41274 RepID=UPI003F95060F
MGKGWIKIAAIFIGTVIGAGFASGREIVEFFGVYGIKGFWGIYILGILLSMFGSILLIKIYKYRIKDMDDLIEIFFPKNIKKCIDILIIISLYTGFSIMVSGSGALFQEQFHINPNMGIFIMIFLSFLVFLFSLEGFSIVNTILVPILIVGIICISFYLSKDGGYEYNNLLGKSITYKGNFISSSLLYFGSNSLIIIVVFSSLLPLIKNKKTAIAGGVVGGLTLFFLAISIIRPILIYYEEIKGLDIPMLYIASLLGIKYKTIYSLILWIAMFTTAVANGFGFINKFNIKNRIIIFIFCISSIPLAKLGFSELVGIIYPISGAVGFIMMIMIIFRKPSYKIDG